MTGSPPPPRSQGLDPALISTIKLVEKYETANWSLRQGDGEANKRIKQNYIFTQIPQTLTLRFSVSSRGEYIENGCIGLYGWRFMKQLAEAWWKERSLPAARLDLF